MTVHLSGNKDSGQAYCNAANSQGVRMTSSLYLADCLDWLRKALSQSTSGLHVIKGVVAEALPD